MSVILTLARGEPIAQAVFVAAVGVLALEVMQQGHKDHGCKGPFRCRAHSRRTITSIIKNHAANCNRKINGRRPPGVPGAAQQP